MEYIGVQHITDGTRRFQEPVYTDDYVTGYILGTQWVEMNNGKVALEKIAVQFIEMLRQPTQHDTKLCSLWEVTSNVR